MKEPAVKTANIKVMRSYDYCHFEVQLGIVSDEYLSPEDVDGCRKEAMRLVDKAIEQYKTARSVEDKKLNDKHYVDSLQRYIRLIEAIPEGERTPKQVAKLKAMSEYFHTLHLKDYRYDCDDEFNDQWEEHPDFDEDEASVPF